MSLSVSDGDRTAPASANSEEPSSSSRSEMPEQPNTSPRRTYSVPNVPAPVNGMIKIYDHSHRTFTRPHSAKTVFFYNESDEYFAGVRVPISKARYRNMEALMDDLNVSVPMPFGVRRLVTPYGRTPIRDINQLQHLGKYVCSSTKWARRFNMSAVERAHKARMATQNKQVQSTDESLLSTSLSASWFKEKSAPMTFSTLASNPIQVLFVVNGRPSRVYRSLLRTNKTPSFDGLLQEVSEGLQLPIHKLFTFDGRRVLSIDEVLSGQHQRLIACLRHERPFLKVDTLPPIPRSPHRVTIGADGVSSTQSVNGSRSKSLPPTPVKSDGIKRPRPMLPRLSINRGGVRFAQGSESLLQNGARRENSIERPARKPPIPRRLPLTTKKIEQDQIKREGSGGGSRKSSIKRELSADLVNNRIASKRKVSVKRLRKERADSKQEPAEREEVVYTPSKEAAAIKIQAGWRGYLVRRQLRREHEAATKIQRQTRNYLQRIGGAKPEECCEAEMAALVLQRAYRQFKRRRLMKQKELFEIKIDKIGRHVANQAATLIQAGWRGHRARRKHKVERNIALKGQRRSLLEVSQIDHQRARRASTMIQAAFRGYRVRKKFARPTEVYDPWASMGFYVANNETEEERLAREEQAAIVIQSAFRGYIVRKNLRTTLDNIIEEAVEHAESTAERNVEEETVQEEEEAVQEEEEAVQEEVEEQPKTKRRQSKKTNKRSKKKEKTEAQQLDSITYTISVYTGNRWAADTDADLYIILQGENSSSEKHWLRQTPQDMKFAQNQVDTFEIQSGNHGTLSKIVIGHEKNGFGAGIFIERVLVVENIADGRQFFFPCAKWFDSQQVDGKIERTLGCIGFYDMSAAGVDPEATKGRWLLTVHTGDSHGNGGTTSNLSVTAFGSYGQSEAIPISDANLSQAGSFSSFEVSFGEVGELYKLRFETDGSGSSPDYYLDYLEMVDQDTSERITLKCGKWLSWTEKDGEQKMTLQPFRELTVVRADVEPLPLIQYDGVITSTELRSTHLLDGQLEVQIIGEFGETGSFPVAIPSKVAGSLKLTEEIPFNVEAVSVGRIRLLRFTFPVDDSGEAVSEGFALLQSIYDKHNIPVTTAVDWVVHKVVVRESSHAPYRFLFGESHVLADEDRNGVVRKDLLLSEMEGLPTRLSKKRSSKRPPAKWVISLTTGETADAGTNVVPRVTLCGDRAVSDTISLAKDDLKLQPGTTVELELNTEDLGQLYKVRLQMDSLPPADGSTDSDTSSSSWYLKKMRLRDSVSCDELRFPVEMWLDPDAIIELPAVWPDSPPLPLIVYQVIIYTGADSSNDTNFTVFLNIYGSKGDIGRRSLRNAAGTQPDSIFKPSNADTFELEAVSVQNIESIEIGLLEPKETSHWFVDRVQILDSDGGRLYMFDVKSWFSASKGNGSTQRRLSTTRVTEAQEE